MESSAMVYSVPSVDGSAVLANLSTSATRTQSLQQSSLAPIGVESQMSQIPLRQVSLPSGSALRAQQHAVHITEQVEQSFRRKTPSGTIDAGFRAATTAEPPQKYQILPRADKKTFSEHQQARRDECSAPSVSVHRVHPALHEAAAQDATRHLTHDSHLVKDAYSQPDLQVPACCGTTVPSVMQPSLQHAGPTASGPQGSGPYGPYWHDGTFVPYRPAVVRDPRFYYHQHGPGSPQTPWTQESTIVNHTQLGAPAQQQPPHWTSSIPVLTSEFTTTKRIYPADRTGQDQVHVSPQELHTASHHLYPKLKAMQTGLSPGPHPVQGNQTFAIAGSRRNELFAWALQQYRNLLYSIQQARRWQQSRHGLNQVKDRHPAYFPKPPRQSRSRSWSAEKPVVHGFQESLLAARPAQRIEDGVPKWPWNVSSTPQLSLHHKRFEKFQAAHASMDLALPASDVTFASHTPARRRYDSVGNDSPKDRRHMLPTSTATIPTEPAQSGALTALETMTAMCEQGGWQWSEGMHLCGCLAYGLGQYEAALAWYDKVLKLDPKHLECCSNMAATLLALGRKSEAERHWSSVVKAAPNYFEAVEHLIGLLCYDRRSRDATKLIEHVENALRLPNVAIGTQAQGIEDWVLERSNLAERYSQTSQREGKTCRTQWDATTVALDSGFGSSGFAIPGSENGRILALIHAKGNMLYALGDNAGAAHAFEEAVMLATGRGFCGIQDLVRHILSKISVGTRQLQQHSAQQCDLAKEPILLAPEQALATAKLCFPYFGELPGLHFVPSGPNSIARKAMVATTSNSLLSLAKIFQDGMSNANRIAGVKPLNTGIRDVLALYYLSLALQPSPSTANNVGILLAGVQQVANLNKPVGPFTSTAEVEYKADIPGVVPGSGIALALQYYNYGLQLDQHHAHLYTNLGSLLKDIGQLDAAIDMYERAVKCDGKFDIALANLANAVKDRGRISDAIVYYRRAVEVNSDFAEAVCGLANALNSVCAWEGRGGIAVDRGSRDRWHVDSQGMLLDARHPQAVSSGWMKRVVDIVEKQLIDARSWGKGSLESQGIDQLVHDLFRVEYSEAEFPEKMATMRKTVETWCGRDWEGGRLVRLIERATKRATWRWYRDVYVEKAPGVSAIYFRPTSPKNLSIPPAPTVLPFHTFTTPMSAKQIRRISQQNGLRISTCTLRMPWLPKLVFAPPQPPAPYLRVGYVSSDFNNHPLAHLMQSVFGMHDIRRVKAYCYATTASDKSGHRLQIETEAPVFWDASSWSTERLVTQIVDDQIHILINLNGYTRGARNEVFAARPAPVQMSFMGFAGTLGAEWCDYLLADETAVPVRTLRPWRRNVDLDDQLRDEHFDGQDQDWVYGENIIYCRDTFFCCDHRQSAPDAREPRITWQAERRHRWTMRKKMFPQLSDETLIFGNFNQLYKIDPTTYRTWLRILARVPNSVLWLLRFPDLGESHLMATARAWAGEEVASRVIFTDVAPKHLHISRARVCDLVLDTAECNAHTTAADVLWSGTPLLTLARYEYKMCSRMAASILKGALPSNALGRQAARELIADCEEDYEEKAVGLARSLKYEQDCDGDGRGRLLELRRLLFEARWTSALFDTARWVRDLEEAYGIAWTRWVNGEGGDIWLDEARSRQS